MASKKQVDEVKANTSDPLPRGPAKHARVEKEAQEEEVEIRVMDSDTTLVNEDEEQVARIDVDDVCVRYPTVRASMKAVCVMFDAKGTVLMSCFD